MSDFWAGKRVLVTGGSGFIGSHLATMLAEKGARVTVTIHSSRGGEISPDLSRTLPRNQMAVVDLTRAEDCTEVCKNHDVVVSAAHIDGSTSYKKAHPADIFRQNLLITLNVLDACRQADVERLLILSSAEVYSPDANTPIRETEGFRGQPDSQTIGYAWSKRMSEFAADLYGNQYSLRVGVARPNNVYGPGDHFDTERGRIIPTLIRRAIEADDAITIWGNGSQVRSFLHVKDLARGLIRLLETSPGPDPINFGGLEVTTVRQLAELIVRLVGTNVQIVTDASKPSGPQRRVLDIEKAQQILGWRPEVTLETGLKDTITFFRENYASRDGIRPHVPPVSY